MLQKILLCTVGGSHQPIMTAIQDFVPDYIYFFCTEGYAGSEKQITGQGNVIKKVVSDDKFSLPNIPTQAKLASDQYEVVLVDKDDLNTTYNTIFKTIPAAKNRFPGSEIVADYTGGTKGMSVALVLAALEHDILLHLVTGQRSDLVKVADGTQMGMPVDYESIRMCREMSVGLSPWKQHGYAQSVIALESFKRPSNKKLKDSYIKAFNLSKAFDAWDRFDHGNARSILSNYSREIGKTYSQYLSTLGMMTKDSKLKEPALICDLWLNALRRACQGRYDDAVSRVYRVIEWTAQWILKEKCGVETSDLPEDFIPPDIKIRRNNKNKYQAPLSLAWELVAAKTDSNLADFKRKNHYELQKKLHLRNGSILAHGFTPIDFDGWNDLKDWMEETFWPYFMKDATKVGLKTMSLQLPDQYEFEI